MENKQDSSKNNDINNKDTDKKLSKMREMLLNQEKCKEIAKKLTQYIRND